LAARPGGQGGSHSLRSPIEAKVPVRRAIIVFGDNDGVVVILAEVAEDLYGAEDSARTNEALQTVCNAEANKVRDPLAPPGAGWSRSSPEGGRQETSTQRERTSCREASSSVSGRGRGAAGACKGEPHASISATWQLPYLTSLPDLKPQRRPLSPLPAAFAGFCARPIGGLFLGPVGDAQASTPPTWRPWPTPYRRKPTFAQVEQFRSSCRRAVCPWPPPPPRRLETWGREAEYAGG